MDEAPNHQNPLITMTVISGTIQGASNLFVNSHLTPKMSSFYVANLRNSLLLRAIRALNLNILDHNLLRSE